MHHARHNAVDVDSKQTVLGAFLDRERDADCLVFLVLREDFRLLGLQRRLLRRDLDATVSAPCGEYRRIVIQYVTRRKFHLDGLARGTEVRPENVKGNVHTRVTRYAEDGVVVLVELPTVGGEVEAGKLCLDRTALPSQRMLLVVASARAGQIKLKVRRLRTHVQLVGGHRECDGLDRVTAYDRERRHARIERFVRPDLLCAVYGKVCHRVRAVLECHRRGDHIRRIHDVRDRDRAVLHHRLRIKRYGNDRFCRALLIGDQIVEQMIGFDGLSLNVSREIHLKGVASVSLRGYGVGLLATARRDRLCADLCAVDQEVYHLLHRADRRVIEGDRARAGNRAVEVGGDRYGYVSDRKAQRAAIAVNVGDFYHNAVRARCQILGERDRLCALLDLSRELHRAADRYRQRTVARRHALLKRCPVKGDLDLTTRGYRLGKPARGVDHRDARRVCARAAAASATADSALLKHRHTVADRRRKAVDGGALDGFDLSRADRHRRCAPIADISGYRVTDRLVIDHIVADHDRAALNGV